MTVSQLSWDNFRTTILIAGQQRVHRVAASPLIEIFADGSNRRLGIAIEAGGDASIPPAALQLLVIDSRVVERHGRQMIELSTAVPTLFQQLYYFATAVAERVLTDGRSAAEAIDDELQFFAELLGQRQLLGIERQLGVIGELVFLERLISLKGPLAVTAWLGPSGEPHDFRVGNLEYEVKTTLAPRRVHTINGEEQLVPSVSCVLSLVSVALGPAGAGAGFSLADKAHQIANQLAAAPALQLEYWQLLKKSGYQPGDAVHYSRRFTVRRPLAVVAIDTAFPAITRPVIQSVLGAVSSRVEAIRYDIDIEGLEREDGSSEFAAMMPH